MKNPQRLATTLLACALGVGLANTAQAATFVWDGGGADSNWATGGNWVGDVAPSTTDDASFWTAHASGTTVNLNGDQTANSLILSYTSGTGAPTIGTASTTNILTLTTGNITNSSAASSGSATINANLALGAGGTWNLGTVTGLGLTLNGNIGDSSAGNGAALTITTVSASPITLGKAGNTYAGKWLFKSSGTGGGATTININAVGALGSGDVYLAGPISGGSRQTLRFFDLGTDQTVANNLFVSDAAVSSANFVSSQILVSGTTRTLTLSGVIGQSFAQPGQTGRLYLGGDAGAKIALGGASPNSLANTLILIDGITVRADKVGAITAGSSIQMFNNTSSAAPTSLIYNVADTNSRNFTFSNFQGANAKSIVIGGSITSGTATFSGSFSLDAATKDLILTSAAGGTVDFTGQIKPIASPTGAAGIIKQGNGIVKLSNASNTYTGTTTVSAGTLLVNGNLTATSAVSVAASGTLAGSGSIANTTTVSGTLAPGNSPGTLTLAALVLNSDAALSYELNALNQTVGSNINDLLQVNGNLTLDGTFNLASIIGGSELALGSYRLINYTGLLTDNTLDLGTGLPTGFNYTIDTATTGQVNLIVAAIPEPATLGLFAVSGIGGLMIFARRKTLH